MFRELSNPRDQLSGIFVWADLFHRLDQCEKEGATNTGHEVMFLAANPAS